MERAAQRTALLIDPIHFGCAFPLFKLAQINSANPAGSAIPCSVFRGG
jgi:hypothetical protein